MSEPNEKALPSPTWDGVVPRLGLEDYAAKYKDTFAFERKDGILLAQMHHNGGPGLANYVTHGTWAQAWLDIGNDPENDVMILTGTGEEWVVPDLQSFERSRAEFSSFEWFRFYQDAQKLVENLVNAIDFPTIGAINGSGGFQHTALVCDITLCSENTLFFDPHFLVNAVPGDGIGLSFQELMGNKRAIYYMYTGATFTAQQALEWGVVNEVLPADQLLPRAWELAEMIRRRPISARHFTSALSKRIWKRRMLNDYGFHLAHEALGAEFDKLFKVGEPNELKISDGNIEDYPLNVPTDPKDKD
jgi:enoyl-CoA hydratase/carnithine racemase